VKEQLEKGSKISLLEEKKSKLWRKENKKSKISSKVGVILARGL